MTIRTIARWVTLIPLFLIPFIPLVVADGHLIPNLFFPFITPKAFAFRILVEIALGGYVLLAIMDKRYRPTFSWTSALYAGLLVWMTIANALAVNPHKAFWSNYERMDGWITLVHVFAFFLVLGSVLSVDKLWRKWWMWFLSAATIVCAYGLFQLAGMADIHQGGVRVDASLGNAAYLAVYLLFVTAIALWQGIESKGFMRYALLVLACISTGIIFATATRGAVIGLVGAVALGAILWTVEAGKKSTRIAAGSVLIGLIVLMGAFFALKNTPFIQHDPTLSRIASISVADGSTRFALWDMALKGVAERPIFGWGQEGFNYIFQKYYDPSLYAQEPWFDRAHNTYFDWLTTGGVPALLLFLAMLGSAAVAFYRKSTSRPERILLIAVLAAYAFQALFVFDNLMSYVCLAAVLAVAHSVSHRPLKALESIPEPKKDMVPTVWLPIISAVFVGIIWMVNVPSMAAAHDLVYGLGYAQSAPAQSLALFKKAIAENGFAGQEVSEQFITFASGVRSRTDVPADLRTSIVKDALTRMKEEVDRAPHDARLRIQYATGLRSVGLYQDALKQSEIALTESPKKQTMLMERGYEFWEAGDFAQARDTFVEMYELDTSFTQLAAYAAAGHIATGDVQRGQALLLEAFGTTEVDSDALVMAYFEAKRFPELVQVLQKHFENDQSLSAHLRLASALMLAGRSGEARSVAQMAYAKFPEAAQTITAFLNQIPN